MAERVAPWTRRGFWPWLACAVILGRLAGLCFGVLNVDEDEFCVIGKMICGGAISYAEIGEFKPPLTHLAFVPAGLFGPVSIVPMRVLGILWVLATALVAGRAAREWTGDELAGRAAPFLVVLASMCEVPSTSAELLMNLPAAAALLFHLRAGRSGGLRDHFLAGLCVGAASLFKHQGGILLVAFALADLWNRRRSFFAGLLALAGGFAIPWLAAMGTWSRLGHLDEFLDWVFWRNFGYASGFSTFSWMRALGAIVLCVASAVVPWALAMRETMRRGEPLRRGLVLSLWLTWIPVAAGGRFYEHYFLQFVPPLAVLGARSAAELIRSWTAAPRATRLAALAALVLQVAGYTGYTLARGLAGRYPNQDLQVRELSGWLREHAPPEARLFVWGHAPQLYYLSRLAPGSRYLSATTQIGGFDPGQLPADFDVGPYRSRRDVELLISDLETRRTELFVDTAPADIHSWSSFPLAKFPELERYLDERYQLIGEPAGAKVFRRR
ncbi:MAG: ArnT family glycosyltransferase [Myxococcales bacterium]